MPMLESRIAIVAVVLAMTSSCKCSEPTATNDAAASTTPSKVAVEDADAGPPLALYDDSPTDPYNVLHHTLYGAPKPMRWTRCLEAGRGCLDESAQPGAMTESMLRPDPRPALRPDAARLRARAASIEKAAKDIARIDPERRPIAAVWLGQAVWAAFDALVAAQKDAPLLDVLAGAMKRLALPRVTLMKLEPSLFEVMKAQPEVFEKLQEADFTEIVALESEPPGSAPTLTTTHARQRGSRSVFRRFVHVPAGAPTLRELTEKTPSSIKLPPGSIAIIVESPLAIANDGSLVVLPLVVLVEVRHIKPITPDLKIRSAPFDVLDGRARFRADSVTESLPLTRLAPDAPFPQQGSCGGDGDILPMRRSCLLCHGPTGDSVRSFAHGDAALRVVATAHEVPKAAIADKSARADFAELTRRLAR
jgi:hypothetical protein